MLWAVEERLLLAAIRASGLLTEREQAQTLAEYSLMLTLIAVGVTVAGMIVFRTQITANFTAVTSCLTGSC